MKFLALSVNVPFITQIHFSIWYNCKCNLSNVANCWTATLVGFLFLFPSLLISSFLFLSASNYTNAKSRIHAAKLVLQMRLCLYIQKIQVPQHVRYLRMKVNKKSHYRLHLFVLSRLYIFVLWHNTKQARSPKARRMCGWTFGSCMPQHVYVQPALHIKNSPLSIHIQDGPSTCGFYLFIWSYLLGVKPTLRLTRA